MKLLVNEFYTEKGGMEYPVDIAAGAISRFKHPLNRVCSIRQAQSSMMKF